MKEKWKWAAVLAAVVVSVSAGSLDASAAELADVFDAVYYADSYPDLKAAFGYDAQMLFWHYVFCGLDEGRSASPKFDVRVYRESYPDLEKAFGDDWYAYIMHYLLYGEAEGRTKGVLEDVSDPDNGDYVQRQTKYDTQIYTSNRKSKDITVAYDSYSSSYGVVKSTRVVMTAVLSDGGSWSDVMNSGADWEFDWEIDGAKVTGTDKGSFGGSSGAVDKWQSWEYQMGSGLSYNVYVHLCYDESSRLYIYYDFAFPGTFTGSVKVYSQPSGSKAIWLQVQ